MPELDGEAIKALNHLPMDRLREEAPEPGGELVRAMSVAGTLGRALGSDIHFAANAVEVVYNIHRWNADMARLDLRERWRKRPVRYFVHDPRSGQFAPSKFAAYLLLPEIGGRLADGISVGLTGMGLKAYTEIDQKHPLFDGNRAWRHLHEKLGMAAMPLESMEAGTVDRFWRWAEEFKDMLGIQKAPVVLTAPLWGY